MSAALSGASRSSSCASEPSLAPAEARHRASAAPPRPRSSASRAGLLGDANALDGLEAHVEAGAALLLKLAEPSRPVVAPRLDRELVTRVALEREAAAPAIVVEERHRGPAPFEFGRRAIEHLRRDLLVTVGEDVGPDLDRLADDALHWRAAAVDLRPHRLDDDAVVAGGLLRPRLRLHRGGALGREDAHGVRRERQGLVQTQRGRRVRRACAPGMGRDSRRCGTGAGRGQSRPAPA